ncbi:MAG: HEAT repeat domain-containing protein [Pirellulaceae bacterium]|nr:HEAT repeat domain-containing protein [Pirellulaceae bacterium]
MEPDKAAVSIKSPHERMVEYREMAKQGPSHAPEEQQRIAGQLAGEFRAENDPLIRAQIVRTLSKFRVGEADGVLRDAMEDSSLDVRIAACQVWGDCGSPEAVELLGRRIASDTNTDVRLAAARALGETRDQAAVAKLGVALDDSDPALQYRAVLSLRRLTGENLGNDVNRWRQYVKGEPIAPVEPISIAERLRQMF